METKRVGIIVLFCFLFCSIVPAQAAALKRDVHIVFVTPPGESFSKEDCKQIRANIQAAFDWWSSSRVPTQFNVLDERIITSTLDIFKRLDTSTYGQSAITMYIVDNRHNWQLFSGHSALAYIGTGPIYITSMAIMEPHTSTRLGQATITHELGHSVYGLTDLPRTEPDIMGEPWFVYNQHFIGCVSLGRLGYPCNKTFLMYIGT